MGKDARRGSRNVPLENKLEATAIGSIGLLQVVSK